MDVYKTFSDTLAALTTIAEHDGEQKSYRILLKQIEVLSNRRKELTAEQDKKEMAEFQKKFLPLLHESSFARYVYNKPRGYAGDFVTQEMIWNALTKGKDYRYLGKTNFGKLISAHSYKMKNPRANINRLKYIKQKLNDSGNRIASIGCGCCIELWNMKKDALKDKNIVLLDLDNLALERAHEKIGCNGSKNITFINENILKFIAIDKDKNLLGERDLIYSLGLIDYFSVKSAKRIMAALWKHVAPGGTLFFTNAHPGNPTRFWMEYVGEWFLCYKEEPEMMEIVADLPDIENVAYQLDRLKVYQYIEVRKKA